MATAATCFDTQHIDMIVPQFLIKHDAQLDYYGKRLATCSSDKLIKIFGTNDNKLLGVLAGHEGPVWGVAWAHPMFGDLLASCSYDGRVFIWKEINGTWQKIKDHNLHSASVNSIAFGPHEYGLLLACGSSDGRVSILEYKDNIWEVNSVSAHGIGVNAVSWMPAIIPGSLFSQTVSSSHSPRRFASGGCDNTIKIWIDDQGWKEECLLQGHEDWIRDLAFAPNIGVPKTYLASCSQDKTVKIWSKEVGEEKYKCTPLGPEGILDLMKGGFSDVVWRVSWSLAGNLLAVSCGDNKITLWKEGLDGKWALVGDINEAAEE